MSKFRFAVAEVVRRAERGEPTILTHYHRDVAAVVPVEMLPITDNPPPEKKAPPRKLRIRLPEALAPRQFEL